ncbi:MAG: HAD family phosphatase [Pyrinomonadaceae bacterium]|nr:HAD family phosphatase [Pyrinomonadaceae bacterium]
MIKLLALDLDGTLLDSRGKIPEENTLAIRSAEDKGVLVTIATGRRFRDARPVALEIGFNAPIVTHNGALLKFAESLEIFDSSSIGLKTVNEILRVGKEFGGEALVSTDPHGKGTLLYETVSEENIPLQRYIVWSRLLHGDEAEEAVHHVEDLNAAIGETEVIHISFSGTCDPMFELQQILERELGETVNILATRYPHLDFTLLDILPPDTSKATAIEILASKHGLTEENVMVIGDNFNDLEMLEYARTAVVMGNADESLLQREEFYTTLSNNENGVAAAINKYILGDING